VICDQNLCVKHSTKTERPVAVTGLNLQRRKRPPRLIKILAPGRGHSSSSPEHKTRQSDQECLNKKLWCDFSVNVARFQEKLLCFAIVGLVLPSRRQRFYLTTKNLELLRGSPWPTPEIQQRSLDFPQDKETSHKKLHRYFSGKLGGIYIAWKRSSTVARALKDSQE
jgi:hypothetical protein